MKTVSEVLEEINKFKPNALSQNELVGFIDDLESEIVLNVFLEDEYVNITSMDRELVTPNPYYRIYKEYLIAMIDNYNEDTESYSLSSRVFNETMKEFNAFVRRNDLDAVSSTSQFTNYF